MPKRAPVPKIDPSRQWWLLGDEFCLHCGQHYVYELQHRCADCDGPGCSYCVVSVEERSVCVACADIPAREQSGG